MNIICMDNCFRNISVQQQQQQEEHFPAWNIFVMQTKLNKFTWNTSNVYFIYFIVVSVEHKVVILYKQIDYCIVWITGTGHGVVKKWIIIHDSKWPLRGFQIFIKEISLGLSVPVPFQLEQQSIDKVFVICL